MNLDTDVRQPLKAKNVTPEEKREFLQNVMENLQREPDKNNTKKELTNLLEDYFDQSLSPGRQKKLENMLGTDLDMSKEGEPHRKKDEV